MDIKATVIGIIADQAGLEPEDVTPQSTLEELGVDSMGVVECIFALEEAFDIQVPFNANEPEAGDFDISSVARVIEGVEHLVKEKP